MNKWFTALLAIILLSMTIPSALAGQVAYWNMNDTTDQWNSHDATNNGAVGTTDYAVFNISGNSTPYASDFELGDTDYWNVSDSADLSFTDGAGNDEPFSLSLWMKPESHSSFSSIFGKYNQGGSREYNLQLQTDGKVGANLFIAAGTAYIGRYNDDAISDGNWYHIVLTYDGTEANSGIEIYIDNVVASSYSATSSGSYTGMSNTAERVIVGARGNGGSAQTPFDGIIDEVKVFDHELNATEIENLYYYGQTTVPAGNVTRWGLYVDDLYDDSNLAGVNVTFASGCTNTTNAAGYAEVNNETSGCGALTGTITNVTISLTNYTSNETSYTVPENSSDNAGMYQKLLTKVYAAKKISGDDFTDAYNITTGGSKTYANGTNVYSDYGSISFTFSATGWYDRTITDTVAQVMADPINVTGVFDNYFTITAQNTSGGAINTFTINASEATTGYAESVSTTNGSAIFNLTQGYNYTFIIDATDFALANVTKAANATTNSYQFTLPPPSLNISIYDEQTDAPVDNVTFTVSVIGASVNYNYTTNSTGNLYLNNILTAGNWTIRYSATNWSNRDYYVTVGFRENQSVTLYAIQQSESNLLPIKVTDLSGNSVEDAVIHFKRWFVGQGAYTVVEMSSTGADGKSNLYFEQYDAFYEIAILYNGVIKSTIDARRYTPTDVTNGLVFAIDIGEDAFESWIPAVGLMSSGGITYNNNTREFAYTYADGSGLFSQMCLYVYTIGRRDETLVNSTCSSSSSATIVTGHPATTQSLVAKAIYDTTTTNSEYVVSILGYQPLGTAYAVFGRYGPFLTAFVTGTIGLLVSSSAPVTVIMGIVGLVLGTVLFQVAISWQTIMVLAILALGVAALMGWRRTS